MYLHLFFPSGFGKKAFLFLLICVAFFFILFALKSVKRLRTFLNFRNHQLSICGDCAEICAIRIQIALSWLFLLSKKIVKNNVSVFLLKEAYVIRNFIRKLGNQQIIKGTRQIGFFNEVVYIGLANSVSEILLVFLS